MFVTKLLLLSSLFIFYSAKKDTIDCYIMVCYIPLFKVLFLLITLLICSAFLRSPRSSTVQRSLFSSDLLVDNVVDSELFFRPLQSDDYERGISITFSHQRTTPNFWFHSPLSPCLSLLVFPSSSPYSPITPTFSPSHKLNLIKGSASY